MGFSLISFYGFLLVSFYGFLLVAKKRMRENIMELESLELIFHILSVMVAKRYSIYSPLVELIFQLLKIKKLSINQYVLTKFLHFF